MKTVYSPLHAGHAGQMELVNAAFGPGFEKPSRAEFIKARGESERLGPIIGPVEHDLAAAKRVHRADYIDFLPTVWPQWVESGFKGSAMPFTWPTRGLRGDVPPKRIDALLGYYSFDGGATFVEGTWAAIKSSYDVALNAARLVKDGERAAFALCRPPGHHAGAGFMGGYCYINNAAVAAQWFRDQGAKRVSILDVDYHHGNGTQDIVQGRDDIMFASIHADPRTDYPFFWGHADESKDNIRNLPLPRGTDWAAYQPALAEALEVDGAGPERRVEIEGGKRAAGALPLVLGARDEHDRAVEPVDESRRDDSDHAEVPVLAPHDIGPPSPGGLRPRFDLAAGAAPGQARARSRAVPPASGPKRTSTSGPPPASVPGTRRPRAPGRGLGAALSAPARRRFRT